jgi:hypothetical protein
LLPLTHAQNGTFGRPSKPLAISVGFVILLIASWLVFTKLSAEFRDRYESFYASLADAEKNGAITRGWIPDDILPSTTRDIHELHDHSPSREWCTFRFATDDSDKRRKNFKRIDVIPPSIRVRDPKVPWWPAALKGTLKQ